MYSQFVLSLMTLYTMTVLNGNLLVMYHRISVMAVDSKFKAVSFCKQQNLGTKVFFKIKFVMLNSARVL